MGTATFESLQNQISVYVSNGKKELGTFIIELYKNYGENCIEQLPENHSVILEDRVNGTTIASKGAFSTAPVFYTVQTGKICCSFLLKNVVTSLDDPRPCGVKIARYLDFTSEMGPTNHLTFYENIQRLLPGESLVHKKGKAPVFHTVPVISGNTPTLDEDAHIETIRKRFVASTRQCLDGSSLTAVTLSGGLDSSSVNCVAQHLSDRQLVSLYVDTDTKEAEEYAFAKAAARKQGSLLLKLRPSDSNMLDTVRRFTAITGAPETNNLPSPFQESIMTACNDKKVDTLLSGFLGDQVIDYGYGYYDELAGSGKWQKLKSVMLSHGNSEKQTRRHLVKMAIKQCISRFSFSKWQEFDYLLHKKLGCKRLYTFGDLIHWAIRHLQAKLAPARAQLPVNLIIGTPVTCQRSGEKKLDPVALLKHPPVLDQRRILEGIYQHIAVETLEQRYQLFTSKNIKVKYPFFNKRLIEATLLSTNEWKIAGGIPRATIRNALKQYLPDEIYRRHSKATFTRYTLRMLFPFYEEFKNSYHEKYAHHPVWTYVDRRAFEKTLTALTQTKLPSHETAIGTLLCLRVMYLGIWLDYLCQITHRNPQPENRS